MSEDHLWDSDQPNCFCESGLREFEIQGGWTAYLKDRDNTSQRFLGRCFGIIGQHPNGIVNFAVMKRIANNVESFTLIDTLSPIREITFGCALQWSLAIAEVRTLPSSSYSKLTEK